MTDFDYAVPIAAELAVHECTVQEEGMVAAMCGCRLRHNPYPGDSQLWQDWNDGYFSECPRRGETEEEQMQSEARNQRFIAELKRTRKWRYIKPTTAEERAEWANDPDPPMPTSLRRWYAKRRQRQERKQQRKQNQKQR